MRYILISIFFLASLNCFSQKENLEYYVFLDKSKDTIIVKNYMKLPKIIDTTFLKKEFNYKQLLNHNPLLKYKDSSICYKVIITNVKQIRRKQEYLLRIQILQLFNSTGMNMEYFNASYVYKMTVKKENDNDYKIDKLELMYGEQ